jgi:hypothetical protein
MLRNRVAQLTTKLWAEILSVITSAAVVVEWIVLIEENFYLL